MNTNEQTLPMNSTPGKTADELCRADTGPRLEVTGSYRRTMLLDWARQVLAFTEEQEGGTGSDQIRNAIAEFQAGTFTVAILGRVKSGKSTLCNAWLGLRDDMLAPVDMDPVTSVVTKFKHADKSCVAVTLRDGGTELVSLEDVRDYVTENGNPGNQKQVRCVEIAGAFCGLEKDLILVDTPGSGSLHDHHDALLMDFLPQADAAIFLCSARGTKVCPTCNGSHWCAGFRAVDGSLVPPESRLD
jgi:hypothetical protein